MGEASALDWVIRGCAFLNGAEGETAVVLREAYGRGLLGLGENRRQHELYAESRLASASPSEAVAVKRLLTLRAKAFDLGRRDSRLLHSADYDITL